ncbi:MAG: carbon-nitrogen family hydrolase [Christensenella sp.]|nr:carbon-nitrogen family hydrolase [Christensenella sp.]
MKICCVQMDVCAAEAEQNFARAELLIRQSAECQPDVILLPELWNTGFAPNQIDASLADEDGARTKVLCGSLAKGYGVNIVAGSVLARKSGALNNTAYVFDRAGSCVAEYDKTHLFSPSGEGEAYQAGDQIVTFPLDGVTYGIMICYDLRFPELARALALSGARVVFIPAEWPRQRTEQLRTLLSARAIENQMFAALCNGCGEAYGTEFGGSSAIVDPLGNVLAQAGAGETIIFAEIDFAEQDKIRKDLPVLLDRRPTLYGPISQQTTGSKYENE